jgi:phosphoribosylanthranilate isomerase
MTRPADAATGAASGASFLGVVFAGGPRQVTVEVATAVRAAAAGVPVLGVYGSQPVEEILRISRAAGLAGAQLHGDYAAEDAARLRAAGLIVWRVIRLGSGAELDRVTEAAAEAAATADAVLVEPRVPHRQGGAGVALDLALAVEARRRLAGRTMVLAGGLTPATVAAAVALVQPDVVDVSSGVEHLPGIKDPDKIARFVEAVFGHSAIT